MNTKRYTKRWLEREIHGQENGETDIQKDKKQKQITCIPCGRITML